MNCTKLVLVLALAACALAVVAGQGNTPPVANNTTPTPSPCPPVNPPGDDDCPNAMLCKVIIPIMCVGGASLLGNLFLAYTLLMGGSKKRPIKMANLEQGLLPSDDDDDPFPSIDHTDRSDARSETGRSEATSDGKKKRRKRKSRSGRV
eukprot:TRINITY_DN9340_c0_g1_i1.p1 TRINITY_DN9340_c0_g1~~TRINITY_DN9340_c0_g1_i1.p1  ORF type:complete len:149 (-),score=36.10 TRINITY_DN9340_c0_g1_i1:29-475(-)